MLGRRLTGGPAIKEEPLCCRTSIRSGLVNLGFAGWMHRQFVLVVLIMLVPFVAAVARDEPRLEAFGGYSWMSTSLLQDTGFLPAREGLSGWTSSLSWNTTHNLGFAAETSAFLGTPSQGNTAVKTRYYSFFVARR